MSSLKYGKPVVMLSLVALGVSIGWMSRGSAPSQIAGALNASEAPVRISKTQSATSPTKFLDRMREKARTGNVTKDDLLEFYRGAKLDQYEYRKFMASLPSDISRHDLINLHRMYAQALANEDLKGAIAWISDIEDPGVASVARKAAFGLAIQKEGVELLETLTVLCEFRSDQWAQDYLEHAFINLPEDLTEESIDLVYNKLAGNPQLFERALVSIVASMAKSDPENFYGRALMLEFHGNFNEVIAKAVSGLAYESFPDALAVIKNLPDNEVRREVMRSAAQLGFRDNPSAVLESIIEEIPDQPLKLASESASSWIANRPEDFHDWVSRQDVQVSSAMLDSEKNLSVLAINSPRKTADLIMATFPQDGTVKLDKLRTVTEAWAYADPTGSGLWIASQEPELQVKLIDKYISSVSGYSYETAKNVLTRVGFSADAKSQAWLRLNAINNH